MTLRVTHVITGLNVGGAEKMLLALATGDSSPPMRPTIICLSGRGAVSAQLEERGATVHHLGARGAWSFPLLLPRLSRLIHASDPDVVQGWMYHGNLAASLAYWGGDAPVLWNIRQSLHRLDMFKRMTRLTIRSNAWLSSRADSIIYNSQIARAQHAEHGFASSKSICIPNGVDVSRFEKTSEPTNSLRNELGFSSEDIVIVSVGRVHPIKGHRLMLEAMNLVFSANKRVRLLIVGRGANWQNEPFSDFANTNLTRERTVLLEERADIPDILSAADISLCTSYTEGFPNAVAEAMAAALPVVVTDVGDSRYLVGDNGTVVPSGNVTMIADAVTKLAGSGRDELESIGGSLKQRIVRKFSLHDIADRYAQHYSELCRPDVATR